MFLFEQILNEQILVKTACEKLRQTVDAHTTTTEPRIKTALSMDLLVETAGTPSETIWV